MLLQLHHSLRHGYVPPCGVNCHVRLQEEKTFDPSDGYVVI